MDQSICINLAVERVNTSVPTREQPCKLFTPGEIIFLQSDFMRYIIFLYFLYWLVNLFFLFLIKKKKYIIKHYFRGHGTYPEDDVLKASVAGVVEQIGKLISVKPLKNRYNGEVGDVVVGRIIEVTQKRWKVDTNSRLDSILLLSSVNLPGGELVFLLIFKLVYKYDWSF